MPTAGADIIYARLRAVLSSVRESEPEMRGFDPGTSAPEFSICIAHPRGPVIAVRGREGWFDAATDRLVPGGRPFDAVTLLEEVVVAVASDGHPAPRWSGSGKDLRQRAWL